MTRQLSSEANDPLRERRLGIIYNSASGRHRRRWGSHPLPAGIPAIQADTPARIRAALVQFAADDIDLLAVAGGDGTLQCVLTYILLDGLFAVPPILALIPTGSTNMTGHDVGFINIKRHGWAPLSAWARRTSVRPGRIESRPVLRIRAGNQPPICGMFFGAGAIHDAVRYTQTRLHRVGLRGQLGPFLAFLRFVKALATGDRGYFSPLRVTTDDSDDLSQNSQTMLLLASTLHRLVLRLRPFWGRENAPLAWTAIAYRASRFFLHLPCIVRGRRARALCPANGYVSHNTHALRFDFDGGFIVDGEFFEARRADGPVRLDIAGYARFLSL